MRFPSKADGLKWLKRAGLSPACVIDVGVHTGTPELMAAFPKAHHLLIEPETAHTQLIAQAYQDIPHTLLAAAASDRDGEATLTSEHRGGSEEVTHSRLDKVQGRPDSGTTQTVRLARLDTLVREAGVEGPFLLKIDTDGHELEVLAGASETLKHCAIVICEASVRSVSAQAAALEAAGLRLFDIIDLAYYFDTLAQVDLVFVNPKVFNPPAINPWRHRSFDWREFRQLQPFSTRFDPLRRIETRLRRAAARLLRPFR